MSTSLTLLHRLRSHPADNEAWERFSSDYKLFIDGFLRRWGVNGADGDDIRQQMLLVVLSEIPKFVHSGRKRAFRNWLSKILRNRLKRHVRIINRRKGEIGGSTFLRLAAQLGDSSTAISKAWDHEHRQFLLSKLLDTVSRRFQWKTMQAFTSVVLDEASVGEVAAELEIEEVTVRYHVSRVLQRLRIEAEELTLL